MQPLLLKHFDLLACPACGDSLQATHESKHSYDEVLEWFESSGFDFLFSIPKIDTGPFSPDEQLFTLHDKGTRFSRLLTQVQMLLEGGWMADYSS